MGLEHSNGLWAGGGGGGGGRCRGKFPFLYSLLGLHFLKSVTFAEEKA